MAAHVPKIVQFEVLPDGVGGQFTLLALWSDGVLTQLGPEQSPTEPRRWIAIRATRIDKPTRAP